MTGPVEAALRSHRTITLTALVGLILLAWAWLITGAGIGMPAAGSFAPASSSAISGIAGPGMAMPDGPMHDMAMAGMDHGAMAGMEQTGTMAGPTGWPIGRFALIFSMWWTMMVAMMVPSAAPTILLYARAAATGGSAARPASGSFLAGYLLAWAGFSLLATGLQFVLESAGIFAGETMSLTDGRVIAGVLIATGAYQLSPLKNACLRQCRNPAQFLSRHYRPGSAGALRMGLLHGGWCLGCCWMLMTLLFAGGVMNLMWIALLTLLVAAEKLLPFGRWIALASGIALLIGGGALLLAQ